MRCFRRFAHYPQKLLAKLNPESEEPAFVDQLIGTVTYRSKTDPIGAFEFEEMCHLKKLIGIHRYRKLFIARDFSSGKVTRVSY